MRFLIIGLVYLGYTFCFWGTTLLAGGPQNTGSWPLMYALLGIGTPPQAVRQGGQTATDAGARYGARV